MVTPPVLVPAPPEERMTPRARAYLAIVAVSRLILGLLCALRPDHFTSGTYAGLKGALPFVSDDGAMILWGVIFIGVGLLNAVPVVTGRETYARAGLLVAVAATGCWLGGFIGAQLTGEAQGPSGLIAWSIIVSSDLTMLRDPMRNPFEPVVKMMMAVRRGR